ncbi:purine-nucleoside phosphorylase [Limibacter armeniacum]|uniref:purine-nucleoside phosphorylase n=1 Tax=Limibacter armeniacum TaxID=466084 RepID=UPI002FE54B70
MNNLKEKVEEAVKFLQDKTNDYQPQFGIILGTGLGGLVDDLEIAHTISYEDIPHFPVSTVEFHSGKLIFGTLSGKKVVVMQGRFHYYEGYSMQEVTFPVRVLKLLGIEKLFVSNAAGGINNGFELSDLMVLDDHINLCYENPLTGPNVNEWGDRFPDMFEPYSQKLIEQAFKINEEKGLDLRKGVYVSVPGPNLETKAEYKFLGIIGADAVGMSTVPEVIVANQMKLPVFAVSVITDLCYPGKLKPVNIDEIIAAAKAAEPKLRTLIGAMIGAQ